MTGGSVPPLRPAPGLQRTGLIATLFPEPPRQVPHERWINIAFRSGHLVSSGILLGGHIFAVAPDRLVPWLLFTVLTGLALIGLELYRSCQWLHTAQGVLVILKMLLTAAAGLWWEQRVALLIAVVLLGSVGSHMPARHRHYSLLHGRELKYEPRAASREPRKTGAEPQRRGER
ncbi:MAG: hypothetical protein ACE147_20805 [Candidatus Methylomirabilales bacterium]